MLPVLDDPVHPEHGEVEASEDEEGGDAGGGQGVQGLVHYQEPGHGETVKTTLKQTNMVKTTLWKNIFSRQSFWVNGNVKTICMVKRYCQDNLYG